MGLKPGRAAGLAFYLTLTLAGCSSGSAAPQDLVEGLLGADSVDSYNQLSRLDSEEAVAALTRGLTHERPRVRFQCLRLLRERRDVTLLPPLIPLLEDADHGVRTQAAESVVALLDDTQALQMVRDPERPLRTRAALLQAVLLDRLVLSEPAWTAWLGSPQPPDVQALIYRSTWRALQSDDRKRSAADATAGLRSIMLRRSALDLADPHLSQDVRTTALGFQAAVGGAPSLALLRKLSLAPHPFWLREAAVRFSNETHSPETVDFLSDVANDAALPFSLQGAALEALGRHRRNPRARLILERCLVNGDERVRARAAQSLGSLRDRRALPALQAASGRETGEEAEFRMAAACAALRQSRPPASR